MNAPLQTWASLPDHIKQQAAPEMLAGAAWSYFGKPVERPRDSELMRWVPPPVCPARRTNADKRRDVLATLKVMPRASLRAVARQTGTSHQFVANVRAGTRAKKRHPRSSMASSEASPTFNQAASVQAQDSLGGCNVNAPAAIHAPDATSGILKEKLSTDDGAALLSVVANCCSNTASPITNAQQCLEMTASEPNSLRIAAKDVHEIGQRNREIL